MPSRPVYEGEGDGFALTADVRLERKRREEAEMDSDEEAEIERRRRRRRRQRRRRQSKDSGSDSSDNDSENEEKQRGGTRIERAAYRHAPKIVFHEKERYFPVSVDWFLSNSELMSREGKVIEDKVSRRTRLDAQGPGTYLQLKRDHKNRFKQDIFRGDKPRDGMVDTDMYYTVHRDKKHNFTNIEYHMLYAMNGPSICEFHGLFVAPYMGMHVGDWEKFIVRLDYKLEKVQALGYQQHGGKIMWLSPQSVRYGKRDKDGLEVYAALHSHALYPLQRHHEYNDIRVGVGHLNFLDTTQCQGNPRKRVCWKPRNLVRVSLAQDRWATFAGRWGDPVRNTYDASEADGLYGDVKKAEYLSKMASSFVRRQKGLGPVTPFIDAQALVLSREADIPFSVDAPGDYKTYVNGKGTATLRQGDYVVSWQSGYTKYSKGLVDGENVIVLKEGQRVVSHNDGYQTYTKGRVDGRNVLKLDKGARVVCANTEYKSYSKGTVDGKNVIVLPEGARVVSWQDGYRSLKPGSKVDGKNVVILKPNQRVMSRRGGRVVPVIKGDRINGKECFIETVEGDVRFQRLREMAAKVAPRVIFHESESYFPAGVDLYLHHSELVDGSGSVLDRNLDEESPLHFAPADAYLRPKRKDATDLNSPVFAGEEVKSGECTAPMYYTIYDDPRSRFVNIEFHYFFPFNGPQVAEVGRDVVVLPNVNMHVGDWEKFTVRLNPSGDKVIAFGFGAHGNTTWISPASLKYDPRHRLHIYSALHSHAIRPVPRKFQTDGARVGVNKYEYIDLTHSLDGRRCVVWKPCNLRYVNVQKTPWARFPGRWGDPISNEVQVDQAYGLYDNNVRALQQLDRVQSRGGQHPLEKTNCGWAPITPFLDNYGLRQVREADIALTVDARGRYLSYTDGHHAVALRKGERVVSHEEGYTSYVKGTYDGQNVIILKEGQHVVSHNDGYRAYTKGRVDGKNVLKINEGDRVVSHEDGFQTYTKGHVDGKNVVILPAGGRIVSWQDGYQTCAKGSSVDGKHCVLLFEGQMVFARRNGHVVPASEVKGAKIDGRNVFVGTARDYGYEA